MTLLLRHICVVSETYAPEVNGVALTLTHLVAGLRAQGYAVSVVRPRQRDRDDCVGDSQVTFVRGAPLPGYKGLQFGLPASGLLRRTWRRCRPDVVYVATEGPLGWSAVRAARHLGIPTLSGFHTNFHSYAQYYRVGWLQKLILRYLRDFHNQTLGTLVPSVDLREQLHTFGFHNVSLLDRGVDSQLFTPERRSTELRRQWGLSDKDLALLYVGRLAPEKNVQLAIDTYYAAKQSNKSVKCVLVGDGPLRAALQKNHPDLIFRGMRTGDELATHYASADIFLFPSETETFGNVTLEAMASGLAIIAYNYAAANRHLTHGETGVVAPYGDSQVFVDLAVKLVCETQLLHHIQHQARAYITAFDWARVVNKFAMLMTDVCGPRGAPFRS
jgi:glycosyltransferase involved in cell wall biosynthesis